MCWVSLLPLPRFSLGLNRGLWTPVKHKHTHTQTQMHRSPCGIEVSAIYQAHVTLLSLSVCGVMKGGVWVGDVFVFPLEGRRQSFTLEEVLDACTLQM